MKIDSIEYISRREIAKKYGVSLSWLKQQQLPRCSKFSGKGKAYYELKLIDEWFKNNMKEIE